MNVNRRGFLRLALGIGGTSVATVVASSAELHASGDSYTFTGSSTSKGSWKFVRQWNQDGGFRQVGPVKYKVDKLHKRYERPEYRTDTYERLTVVLG